jgi:ABC-type branched-subunit amino acid transport system ATPase component/ABC-type branched-subunit amino acid transport system permease subunit
MISPRAMLALFALSVLTAPLVLSEFQVIQMNYIGVAAIIALGLVLLTGVAGVMSFGQQVFAGLAAYTSAVLTTQYGGSPWLGLVLGLALVTVVSLFLGAITLRLSGHYLPIATIAWGIAIYYVFGNLDVLGRHQGLTNIPPVAIGDMRLDRPPRIYYLIWGLLLVLSVASANLLDSRAGRAMRALRSRAVMAESFGVNTTRLKAQVFVLAALLAGLSGWLYVHFLGFVSPSAFNVHAGIDYLFMVILGGTGSVWGAVIGASILTGLKELLLGLLPTGAGGSGNYEIVVLGVLILLLLQRTRVGLAPVLARWVLKPRRLHVPADGGRPVQRTPAADAMVLLQVSGLTKRFGGLTAVRDMSFDVRSGEVLALIGPNGAGKSTVFNMISGVLPMDAGRVLFKGASIGGLVPSEIARHGVARTFQHVNLIGNMTVLENVAIGAHLRGRRGALAAMLRLDRAEEGSLLAEAARHIERVGLKGHQHDKAGNLPLGKQRLVEIARALCADPALLLLDEPAAGLRHAERQALAALLQDLRAERMGILLVEHDMDFLMGLADRVVVMQSGQLLLAGLPAQVQADPAVIEAYLGGAA